MTSPHHEFHQAVRARSIPLAEQAITALPRIDLQHSAALLLLYAEQEPAKYRVAALRWLARLCQERRGQLGLSDIGHAAAALDSLPSQPHAACQTLASLLRDAGLPDVGRVFAPAPT